MADQEIRLCPSPSRGAGVRCILSGGEPVVVLVDLPTGRASTMIHMILKNNPKVKEHAHKAILNNREAWVADRKGIREMHTVFGNMDAHRADTRHANVVFVRWLRETLIPFLDEWDATLRGARGIQPTKVYSGFIMVMGNRGDYSGMCPEATIPFSDAEGTRVRIGGPGFVETVYSIQDILKALKLIP